MLAGTLLLSITQSKGIRQHLHHLQVKIDIKRLETNAVNVFLHYTVTFPNICSFFFPPTQVFLMFDTPPPQVLLRTFDVFVQSSVLPDSVQTFNAYPDSKHFNIFIYVLYLYIEHDFLQVTAVLSHTPTHALS